MARFRLGRHDDAMADFARARAVVAGAGDDVDLEVDLLLDEAVALDWAGDFDGAARLTARALGAHASPRSLRASRLAMADGRTRWRGGDLAGAIGPLERAVALAEACGEDGYETWVAALAMLGFLLPTVGELDRAEACLTRALDGADARRDQLHRAAVIGNRYLLCSVRGELDRLAADMAEYTRLARELGMPGNEYRGELNQAVHAQYLGRAGDAALHAARARGFEERMPDLFPAASAALLLAQIAARRGQREQASAWLGEVRGRAPAGAEERAIAWALERWLAGDLEPGPWIAAAERSAGQGAPETGCELLDLLAAELDRQGRAIDARDLRRRAAALPGVPAFLAHRLAIHDDGAPGCP
jgi:tetratricopeptide (TPR) repeat protein